MYILANRIYFILTITWSLAYGFGQQQNQRDKKCRRTDDNFDGHGLQQYDAGRITQRPMEHIQGFTRRHWMPPLGKYLRRIALTAAMVDEFE
jgi:hypothetical protein